MSQKLIKPESNHSESAMFHKKSKLGTLQYHHKVLPIERWPKDVKLCFSISI